MMNIPLKVGCCLHFQYQCVQCALSHMPYHKLRRMVSPHLPSMREFLLYLLVEDLLAPNMTRSRSMTTGDELSWGCVRYCRPIEEWEAGAAFIYVWSGEQRTYLKMLMREMFIAISLRADSLYLPCHDSSPWRDESLLVQCLFTVFMSHFYYYNSNMW